jgi:hypothetical protein
MAETLADTFLQATELHNELGNKKGRDPAEGVPS